MNNNVRMSSQVACSIEVLLLNLMLFYEKYDVSLSNCVMDTYKQHWRKQKSRQSRNRDKAEIKTKQKSSIIYIYLRVLTSINARVRVLTAVFV